MAISRLGHKLKTLSHGVCHRIIDATARWRRNWPCHGAKNRAGVAVVVLEVAKLGEAISCAGRLSNFHRRCTDAEAGPVGSFVMSRKYQEA